MFLLNLVAIVPRCLSPSLSTGTTSSSNTMVPGPDAHHDSSKNKDPNMDDRYEITHRYRPTHL
jgi:hypothetical protein